MCRSDTVSNWLYLTRPHFWAAVLCWASLNCHAQIQDPDPDWVELTAPTPPVFDLKRQVTFDIVNTGSELKWAIDPTTFSYGSDGVSRLVIIATSASGATNIRFDGINCRKWEVKTYARATPSGQWTVVNDAQWLAVNGGTSSRYALALARQALCDGAVARTDIRDIVRLLSNKALP